MPTTLEKKFNFKMGADPEFAIILQNKRIEARSIISEILKGKKEFTKTERYNGSAGGFDMGKFGNIGWDGACETAEIRPNPSDKPEEIVNNINQMFTAFGKYMSIFELTTLSQHASIGGHIHFEANKDWTTQKQKSIHTQMVSFYMPILMGENKINLALRIRQGYGAMTDYRFDNQGDNDNNRVKTYEFRCPSAEWLTSPKIAQAVLAYLGVIYNEIINHPKNIKNCKDILLKSEKQIEAFQTLALQEYDLLNQALLKNIRKNIKSFEMYDAFKEEIEFVLHPEAIIKEKIKFNYDINNGWKLGNMHKITKKEITSEKSFKEKIKTQDVDTISKMVHIDYNDDAKISEFVNALSLRAGAFNWKLSKQYFIFGLKKGIKDIIVKNNDRQYLTGAEQIKTNSDYDLIERAFEKMTRKYCESNTIPNLMTIDFKTGKAISLRNNVIFIGLPYQMRIDGKTKEFINTIWKIENNEFKPNKKDTNFLENTIGEIEKAKLERKTEELSSNAIIIDNGQSPSGRNQQRALQAINNEQSLDRIIPTPEEIQYETEAIIENTITNSN